MHDQDPIGPARGIVWGMFLSLPFWIFIFWLTH